jgi:DNA repair exonuclease SbcCD nuclease subunit
MKIKLGWVSDSHLGYSQYGSSKRRRDFALGLKNAVDDMLNNKVNAIIHTGDMFNSNRPSAEDVRDLQHIHNLLIAKGTFLYTIDGNHDHTNPPWPEVLIPNSRGGIVLISTYPKVVIGDLVLRGYSSMSKEALLSRFQEDDMSGIDVLLLHQPIKEFCGFPSPNALAIDDVPDIFELTAVGDIHVMDIRQRPSGGWIGYPGSTEMCSSSECPDKYWIELNFGDRKLVSYDPHKIRTRPVLHWLVNTEAELTAKLDEFDRLETELKKTDPREPMLYVKFPTSLSDVIARVRQKLDPDKYIVVLQPIYLNPESATGVINPLAVQAEDKDISVQDLLNAKVPTEDGLYQIASQMLNPDIDAGKALKEFVEARLAAIEANATESS